MLETNIVFVLRHALHPWLRSMKVQWDVNKFLHCPILFYYSTVGLSVCKMPGP
jgi:hypothetical protein